ncbi:ASCH domain-containing protein [Pseudogemmobacter humi]|uniref:ASCH domain-containing protein n=1 Tax=Pseudogemmobacter humi TaxID=2483812 RepID=A0A3P5WYG8_9RHOB|nr:ASCH domain-containing protein [Pseudogemmobacter humi]VDC28264.1 hypothetical protein XINFAN_02039 [Pseudogemmobacter humi]
MADPFPGLPLLALSIRQPWAYAIIHLGKPVENRTWETLKRGPICIHAAKGMTQAEWWRAFDFITDDLDLMLPEPANLPRGGIIGTAEIVDCVRSHPSPWFFGPFGIVLANVRPVEFIPVKGALNFFDWRKNLKESGGSDA